MRRWSAVLGSQKQNGKGTFENQVKTLQKHMGAILVTMRDLKATVEALDTRTAVEEKKEIKEILEAQKVIYEVIVENSGAIKRIDRQMKQIMDKTMIVMKMRRSREIK